MFRRIGLGIHSDDQLAEVASLQHADKGFGRLLLAIANAAIGDAGTDLAGIRRSAVQQIRS